VLLWIEKAVAFELAGSAWEREKPVVGDLRACLGRLAAKHPAIAEITIEYPVVRTVDEDGERKEKTHRGVAKIEVEFHDAESDNDLAPQVREEVIGLLWLSRLYPLGTIWLWAEPRTRNLGSVSLDGAEAKRLRHRYGPRPYGPYPTPDLDAVDIGR
jgi:hypothetical protein